MFPKTIFLVVIYVVFSSFLKENTSETTKLRHDIVAKAESYLGYPYKYASHNPNQGFDCSGLVYFIFKSFDVDVPRSSKGYDALDSNELNEAQIGDVIVFTGYEDQRRIPGHVGIISKIYEDELCFIHASTYKGVIETELNSTYYRERFLYIVNVLD